MHKIFWGFFLVITFVVTLPASWWLLAKVDFAYPILQEKIGITEHIAKFAPKNDQGKKDFELTTTAERSELFHGIVKGIQNQGDGLDRLFFFNANKELVYLFTQAEVIHLKDVAILLDKLKPVVLALLIGWLIMVAITLLRKVSLPSAKQWLLSALVIILLISGVLALGPEKVFNQLHVWVFPDDHQWFFYYEESLMSTMMKAPDLFAYIAAMWALLSVFFTVLLIKLLHVVYRE